MRHFTVVLILGLLAGCQTRTQKELTPEQEASIRREIDSLTLEWWDAWSTFDWDRGLAFIADEPRTTWTGAVRTLYSVDEMRQVWTEAMAGLSRQELEFTNSRTVVLAPDIVWTLREGVGRIYDDAGTMVSDGRFIETAVWVKREGEWKVLLGHDDDPGPSG